MAEGVEEDATASESKCKLSKNTEKRIGKTEEEVGNESWLKVNEPTIVCEEKFHEKLQFPLVCQVQVKAIVRNQSVRSSRGRTHRFNYCCKSISPFNYTGRLWTKLLNLCRKRRGKIR